MRASLTVLLAFVSTAALAQEQAPISSPPPATLSGGKKLPAQWEATAREVYKTAVETPTVKGRAGENLKLATYLAGKLKAAGWADSDIHVETYTSVPGNDTAALIARWPAAGTPKHKPILILAHMDVVDALAADWTTDPFKLVEKDGYFYGRGSGDDKGGLVPSFVALLKLKAAGFKPNRDIVILFTGDEETQGKGAELGATEWRKWTEAEFALNADAGGGAFTRDGKPLGFGLQTSEKTFQTYFFRVRNPGGHSSRPRPDNAIYELADALKKLQGHRFTPALNETTTRLFHRARQAGRRQRSRQGDARLARQSGRRCGRRCDRGQSAGGRRHTHPLRGDPAERRPCRQCAAATGRGDRQLPDPSGSRAQGGRG